MGSLGIQEMLVIAFLALLVFGPDRLPEVARNVGKFVAKFRAEATRSIDELKQAAQVDGLDEELRGIKREIDEVKGSLTGALSGKSTSKARAKSAPPPFDPDAT